LLGFGNIENVGAMVKKRPLFDDYWDDKKIKPENIHDIPMYLTASYSTGLHCEGSFQTFETAPTSRKWLRVHASQEWHDLYRPEAMDDLQRFYDFYAKGIQNGWETETPRVRLTLLGYDGSYAKTVQERPEKQWPPSSQHSVRYYLDASNKFLVSAQPTVSTSIAHESHSLTDCSVSSTRFSKPIQPH
jgi:predicted acyl esterase